MGGFENQKCSIYLKSFCLFLLIEHSKHNPKWFIVIWVALICQKNFVRLFANIRNTNKRLYIINMDKQGFFRLVYHTFSSWGLAFIYDYQANSFIWMWYTTNSALLLGNWIYLFRSHSAFILFSFWRRDLGCQKNLPQHNGILQLATSSSMLNKLLSPPTKNTKSSFNFATASDVENSKDTFEICFRKSPPVLLYSGINLTKNTTLHGPNRFNQAFCSMVYHCTYWPGSPLL